MGFYQLVRQIELKSDIESIWDFISDPGNLKKITPDFMMFEITSKNTGEEIYPGMIISYRVAPIAGIKTLWVTEITQVREKNYFVDEQRVGPYRMWHHEHHISKTEHGTLMTDIVSYKPPFGFLGVIANKLFIEKKLTDIFNHRSRVLVDLFGAVAM